ncbi:MAG: NAD-dependent epimerase/dehydratase family protein [Solirubrobacteraceae bacterium]
MTTVLVTGGSGFIGSHVVDRLAAAGHRPRILDTRASEWHHPSEIETVLGDVRRLDDVLRASRGCDAICHLAAIADVAQVHEEPADSTELNATGTLNVLEAARQLSTPRVVYASTVWVYSDVDADQVDEETLLSPPAHLYTAGKLAGELYCRSYAELYGVESTIVRFGIPYGPRARPAAVIPSFVARARAGEPLSIAGTGEQQRSFVYVEDLAEGVVCALAPAGAGRTYNLAGRETVTIRGLAEIVRDGVAPVEIVHTAGRAGDLRGATICSARAEREIGWRATTPLCEGVKRYADWVEGQPPERKPRRSPIASLSQRTARARSVAARAAAAAVEPSRIGFVSLIALVSSLLPALASTRDVGDATGVTLLVVMLMVPLWSVTVTEWPLPLRRVQAAIAVVIGLVGVALAASLTPEHLGDLGQAHWTAEILFTLLAATALHIVPARLLQQERG